jgi:hypothetical protein
LLDVKNFLYLAPLLIPFVCPKIDSQTLNQKKWLPIH